MGLFNFKRKNAEQAAQELSKEQQTQPENIVSEEKFILETSPQKRELPIYEVYRRFQEDWETKGYMDARNFPDTTYKEESKTVIINQLRLFIKEVIMTYEDLLVKIDGCIENARKSGLIETVDRYNQEKKILARHFEELSMLDKDATEIGERTAAIISSYEMGFKRGITAVDDENVDEIMGKK